MLINDANALIARRQEAEEEIERIMDRYEWNAFIDMLSDICHGKADHVGTNGDPVCARNWRATATAFERARKYQPYSV